MALTNKIILMERKDYFVKYTDKQGFKHHTYIFEYTIPKAIIKFHDQPHFKGCKIFKIKVAKYE